MRYVLSAALAIAASPALAQVSVGNGVVRAGGVTVDSSGVHTPGAEVTGHGVAMRRGGGMRSGRSQSIVANGQHRTVDCGGGSLVVAGNSNVVTVSNCARVAVPGNNNQVTASFRANGAVSMPGNHNMLHWSAPETVKVGVDDPGTGNHVTRGG